MNRVNTKATKLIELYCELEVELKSEEEEPKITKFYPKLCPDEMLKILPNFAFPYPLKSTRIEK